MIFTVVTHTENPKESPTAATKKKNIVTKRMCIYDQRSDSHWWHQSASHKWSRKHQFIYLSTMESRLLRAAIVTWCCY